MLPCVTPRVSKPCARCIPATAKNPARMAAALSLGLAMLLAFAAGARAQPSVDTAAEQAILIDMQTGMVLLEKSPDTPMPTSSMSKIMTVYMLFEALEEGRLSLDEALPVSEYAWRKGGSKMFVEVGTEVRVEDLIRGIVVQSGNDASIVVAEALGGTEEGFAQAMTERARELGLTNSRFANATGWPDPNHYSTARDLAILSQRLIADFPQYYHYFAETEFTFSEIKQGNRNPLLYRNIGADGLKTGHTEDAGYGLAASAMQDERRLVLVVNGLGSVNARAEESARLIAWGFREFDNVALFESGETVETAAVWLGQAETVPLVLQDDLTVTLRRSLRRDLSVVARVQEPLQAPIMAGDTVGALIVTAPGSPAIESPTPSPPSWLPPVLQVVRADAPRLEVLRRLRAARISPPGFASGSCAGDRGDRR